MKRYSVMVIGVLLLMMTACGSDPKPPQTSVTSNTSGSGTVYDDPNQDSGMDDEEIVAEDLVSRDLPVTDDVDDFESEKLSTIRPENERLELKWDPVFFEFDKATLSESAKMRLQDYASALRDNPNLRVLLEGHCDERGTEEYNQALGERRAQQVKRYLIELGVPASSLLTISYGELKPQMLGSEESVWSQNRRVSFTF